MDYYVHPTAVIDQDVQIGFNSKIWHFTHVQNGAIIGRNCMLGQNVYVGEGVIIGDGVKIQNNVSIYQGVLLENNVFCGPSVVFTNDLNPRSSYPKKGLYIKTLVCEGATIGANSTVICGITLGKDCMVGAGAVVTKDVQPHSIVVGNPARHVGWVCHCGSKLNAQLNCNNCHNNYKLDANSIKIIS